MAISLYVLSAIYGNWCWESTFNAGVYESRIVIPDADMNNDNVYGGYGLGQWTNKASAGLHRRSDLINWLDSHGYSWTDTNAQIDFLFYEGYWSHNIGPYDSLQEFLDSDSTNIPWLTEIYMRNWEGINSHLTDRQTFANKMFNYVNQHYDDPDITDYYVGNFYTTEQQKKNNAVLATRYIWSEEPHPPEPPVPVPTNLNVYYLLAAGKRHNDLTRFKLY